MCLMNAFYVQRRPAVVATCPSHFFARNDCCHILMAHIKCNPPGGAGPCHATGPGQEIVLFKSPLVIASSMIGSSVEEGNTQAPGRRWSYDH